jgi:hypothetical protein
MAGLDDLMNLIIRMDVFGYGSVNQNVPNQLITCDGTVATRRLMSEIREVFAQSQQLTKDKSFHPRTFVEQTMLAPFSGSFHLGWKMRIVS